MGISDNRITMRDVPNQGGGREPVWETDVSDSSGPPRPSLARNLRIGL